MSITTENNEGDRKLPELSATLVDIGINYREYEDGDEEDRLVVVWRPDDDMFGDQTAILNAKGVLKVTPGNAWVLRVGGEKRGFDLEIKGNVVNGKLGFKAGAFYDALKEIGVTTPDASGDLSELIGVRAIIKQMTFNETQKRAKQDTEKPFWVPVKFLGKEDGAKVSVNEGANAEPTTKAEVDDLGSVVPFEEALKETIIGKSEKELSEWYEGSEYYNGSSSVPLFKVLDALLTGGTIIEQNGTFAPKGSA